MTSWLKFRSSDAGTDTLLVCLPPGGRGASAFSAWWTLFPGSVQVVVVQPPGREERFGAGAVTDVEAYITAVCERIVAVLGGRRLVLAGACLGGMLGYEICRRLTGTGTRVGLLCVIAAEPPARYRRRTRPRSEAEALDLIRHWAGTPDEVVASPEFATVLMPAFRADLALGDSYDGTGAPVLDVPVLAIAGADDHDAGPAVMAGWSAVAAAPPRSHTLPGGHFVHHEQAGPVARHIVRRLAELAGPEVTTHV